jgi:hypothetical protein
MGGSRRSTGGWHHYRRVRCLSRQSRAATPEALRDGWFTAADAVLPSALVVTLIPVVGALTCLVALVRYVPLPVCAVSYVDGTQDGGHRAGDSGPGAVPVAGQ